MDSNRVGDAQSEDAIDSSVFDKFIGETLDLWINPEIEKRKKAGRLSDDFAMFAAQVIFGEGPIKVRLNDEVKAIATFETANTLPPGTRVNLNDLGKIVDLQPTSDDPNAAHITLLLHRGAWQLAFDFRYNAQRSLECYQVATEFIESARFAIERGHIRVAIENLFAATELMTKALLIQTFDDLRAAKSHSALHDRLNWWSRLGNTDARYAKLLNRLSELRGPARYLDKDLRASQDDVQKLLVMAEDMLADLDRQLQRRLDK
jgi:HEPN domain-containing protein